MSIDSTHLYDAALKLPETERADLAYRLLQTLRPPGIASESDPRLADELQRRLENYRANPESVLPWEEVESRIRKALPSRDAE